MVLGHLWGWEGPGRGYIMDVLSKGFQAKPEPYNRMLDHIIELYTI